MALFKCPECKKKISDKAQNCPKCGCAITDEIRAKMKKRGAGCFSVLLLLAFSFLMAFIFYEEPKNRKPSDSKPPPAKEEEKPLSLKKAAPIKTEAITKEDIKRHKESLRKKELAHLFLSSGEVIPLKRHIQDNLHNPKSYEHIETTYEDKKSHLIVQTTFRATNAFGAIVKNRVTAKVSVGGVILEIISTE